MTDKVHTLVLTIQSVTTADGFDVDGLFGTVILKPEGKKKKGRHINFTTILSSVPAFQKHITKMVNQALELDSKKKDGQS